MIGPVPNRENLPVSGDKAMWTTSWNNWFAQVFRACFAVYQSGITANRPVKDLWIGRQYWDVSLQIPVYWAGAAWKDAAGNTV